MDMSASERLTHYEQAQLFETEWPFEDDIATAKHSESGNFMNHASTQARQFRDWVSGDSLSQYPWLQWDPQFMELSYRHVDYCTNQGGILLAYGADILDSLAGIGVEGAHSYAKDLTEQFMQRNIGYFIAMYQGMMGDVDIGDYTHEDVHGFRFKSFMGNGALYKVRNDFHPDIMAPHLKMFSEVFQNFSLEWPESVHFETSFKFLDVGPSHSAAWLDEDMRSGFVEQNKQRAREAISRLSSPRGLELDYIDKERLSQEVLSRLMLGARTALLTDEDVEWYLRSICSSESIRSAEVYFTLTEIAGEGVYFQDVKNYVEGLRAKAVISDEQAQNILNS